MDSKETEKQNQGPEWRKPKLEEEHGELERTAEELGMSLEDLIEAFQRGQLEELPADTWRTLQNADSRDETWTLDEVLKWIPERNEIQDDEPRDVDRVVKGFDLKNNMPSPVVLFRTNQPPYLIGGNTRHLVARAKKIIPKIFALRSEKF